MYKTGRCICWATDFAADIYHQENVRSQYKIYKTMSSGTTSSFSSLSCPSFSPMLRICVATYRSWSWNSNIVGLSYLSHSDKPKETNLFLSSEECRVICKMTLSFKRSNTCEASSSWSTRCQHWQADSTQQRWQSRKQVTQLQREHYEL